MFNPYEKDCKTYMDEGSLKSGNNDENNDKKIVLPANRQLFLFLFGWLGLSIISTILLFVVICISRNVSITELLSLMQEDTFTYTLNEYSLIMTLSYLILLIGLGLAILKFFKKSFIPKLKNYKDILKGLLAGIIIILFSILYSSFLSNVVGIGVNENESTVRTYIEFNPFISFFVIVLIGPICEELTYRVGLFSLFCRKKKVIAYIACSLVFALIHFSSGSSDLVTELWNLPNYLVSGLILCFAYDKFGIYGCLTAHVFNNLVSYLFSVL